MRVALTVYFNYYDFGQKYKQMIFFYVKAWLERDWAISWLCSDEIICFGRYNMGR
jgi:hypothetical protein